jgi:hypothetical protein
MADQYSQYLINQPAAPSNPLPPAASPAVDTWDKYKIPVGFPQVQNVKSPELSTSVAAGDSLLRIFRPIVSMAAPELLPEVAGFSALPKLLQVLSKGGAYLGTDQLMQRMQHEPDYGLLAQSLQTKPGSFQADLANSVSQWLQNKALELPLRGLASLQKTGVPDIYNYHPTTSQAANALDLPWLAKGAKALEDMNTSAKSAALDRTAGKGFTQALLLAKNADWVFNRNPEIMKEFTSEVLPMTEGSYTPITIKEGQKYTPLTKTTSFQPSTPTTIVPGEPKQVLYDSFSKIDKLIADPEQLQKVFETSQSLGTGENVKKTLQGYQFMRNWNNAVQNMADGSTRIDAGKLASSWADPEMQSSYKVLYNAQTRANINQFVKNIGTVQDKMGGHQFSTFWAWHSGIIMGGGLLGSILKGEPSLAAGAGGEVLGMYVGAQQIGRLLSNPNVARTVVALAGGEPLGKTNELAGKMILRGLNGTVVALTHRDGSQTPMKVVDGQLKAVGQ